MSFRQFGGLNYASKHNIVSSNYNTSNNLLIPNYFGQPNSIVNFLSDISGNIILYGNLTITENVHVNLNVDISGNTTIGGTLDVSNNAFFNSNITVSDNVSIGNNLAVKNNVDISGNTTIVGTLDVSNNAFFNSNITVSDNVSIGNNLAVKNNVDISGNTTIVGTLDVSNNAFFNSNVTVSDNVSIGNNLAVKNNVDISGNTTIVGTLDVSNNAFFNSNVTVYGNATIEGIIDISGSITANTGSFNYLSSSNNTYLATTYGTKVGIGKTNPAYTLDVSGSLYVSGDASFNTLPTCSQTPTLSQQLITKGYADATYSTAGSILDASNTFTGTNTFTKPILAQGGITGSNASFTGNISTSSNLISANASYLGGNNPQNLVNLLANQGSYIGWNKTTYIGETDFVNCRGLGPGGFHFYNIDVSGVLYDPIVSFDGCGNILCKDIIAGNILGATGYFTNVIVTDVIKAQGGITGPTGSFIDLVVKDVIIAQGGITGPTGSFADLIVKNMIKAQGGITGPTGSFANLTVQNNIIAQGGITGPTGSFADLIVKNMIKAQGGITGPTGSFANLTVQNNIIAQGGITGPTGSFADLIVKNMIKAPGGITGAAGSFSSVYSIGNISTSSNLVSASATYLGRNPPQSLITLNNESGLYVGWNQAGSVGETDFVNCRGSGLTGGNPGVGGFNFYNIFNGATASSPIVTFNNVGNISCQGGITGPTGSFKDLISSNIIKAPGGISGATGSFTFITDVSAIDSYYMYLTSSTNYSTNENAAMPKSYIDTVAAGLNPTQSCYCATTSNIDLSNTYDPSFNLDGINFSTLADGSYNILVINQEPSQTTPAPFTSNIQNGVWILNKSGYYYSWSRPINPTPMYVGYDCLGSFSFVANGVQYGEKAYVQTNRFVDSSNSEYECIVGTNPLQYTILYQVKFRIGRGLTLQEGTLNVDSSLNFIDYLDNTSGTLSIGTNSNHIIIGSTSSNLSPIQLQNGITGPTGSFTDLLVKDVIKAQGGITGGTGSFADLIVKDVIIAQGGITGATGSFIDLIVKDVIKAQGGITGPTGSFVDLIVTNVIKAQGGVTGPTGSFIDLIVKDVIIAQGGITGATGSFIDLVVKDVIKAQGGITGPTGSFTDLIVKDVIIAQGGITGPTGSFIDLVVKDVIKAQGGITGPTGSFIDLVVKDVIIAQGGITGPTGSFIDLVVKDVIKAQGGITGPTGSFADLIVKNMIKAPGGITGAAGSFTSLYSTGNISTNSNLVSASATYLGRNPPQSLINLNNQSGLYVGWNQNGGITETYLGETDFVNCRGPSSGGAGVGGFNFYNIFNGATASSPIVTFNNVGNISCQGGITGPTGSFKDLISSNMIKAPGGISGATGSFTFITDVSAIDSYYMYLTSSTNYSTNENAAMPKSYIDTVAAGLNPTQSCYCATTGNINLSNTSDPSSVNLDGINFSTLADGSYNILVINQDLSGTSTLDSTFTSNIQNGVWILNKSGTTYKWSRPINPTPMYVGYDCLGSFSFVANGTIYGEKAYVQTNRFVDSSNSEYECIVGTNPLQYTVLYQVKFRIGRGLTLQEGTLNVDSSLNFIDYLDNTSGTLSIGTNSNHIIIGSTSSNLSPIQLQNGITGPTGSFTDLIVKDVIKAQGGITGPTGSFTDLIVKDVIKAPGGITGATGSFTNLIATTNYGAPTIYPSFLVKDTSRSLAIIPNTTAIAYNSIVQAGDTSIIAQGASNAQTITIAPWSTTASGIRITPSTVTIGAGGTGTMPLAYLQSNGVTGQNLIVGTTNLVNGPLSVSQQFSCQGGITGPTGSFIDLISTNMIKAPGGITGAAGSFTSLYSYNNITAGQNIIASDATYLGGVSPQNLVNYNQNHGLYVGWGNGSLGETDFVNCKGSDVSSNTNPGGFNFYNIHNNTSIGSSPIVTFNGVGNISCQGGINGPTGSFTDLISTNIIKAPGGITGSIGSFDYLVVTNGLDFNIGITGATGSFTYLSSSNNTYLATTTGGVAIGKNTITPNYVLDISGNVIISGKTTSTSFNTTSDYRIKSDIHPLNDTHTVDKLIPVTYLNTITKKHDFGLIAHEVQEQFPFIVNGEKDANDYQSVNYISLIPILIKEIQELKKEIKLLKKI